MFNCVCPILMSVSVLFWFITHATQHTNILFCSLHVLCYICVHSQYSIQYLLYGDTYITVHVHVHVHGTYTTVHTPQYIQNIHCQFVVHYVPCNLLLCGYCLLYKMALWYKCFTCVTVYVAIAASTISMVYQSVALKMKPMVKKTSTTQGYQAV